MFWHRSLSWAFAVLTLATFPSLMNGASAEETTKDPAKATDEAEKGTNQAAAKKVELPWNDPPGLARIAPDRPAWVDPKRKLVVVDGTISVAEGQLEMFACPKGTKEHEAIVSVNCDAKTVHAGLLAVGAKPGSPVQYDPVYKPAKGMVVEIMVLWTDKDGKQHKTRAQEWIRNVKTQKELEAQWVFAGSGFWTDEQDGKRYYHADSGDMVCVSNFPTAMLDLPVQSSKDNDNLLFEAFKGRIPPRGTKVRMVLIPQFDEKGKADASNAPAK